MSDRIATGHPTTQPFSRARLAELIGRERAGYDARHPGSAAAFAAAGAHLLGGVPMRAGRVQILSGAATQRRRVRCRRRQ